MARGKVTVRNETTYMKQPKKITAKIAGQSKEITSNASYAFSVPEGKHDLKVNVTPPIVGLESGHQVINISDDFTNFLCRVTLDQTTWKIQKVSQ